jgi:ornithine cyclodeaminase/alanine dehydrogenase-like protein (mu-crystallin family)
MLFLSKTEAAKLVSMEEAIAAVEKAFLKHATGKTIYPAKSQFTLPGQDSRWWGFMPVYVEGMGVACKAVCDYPENKKHGRPTIISTTMFCDAESGEVKAIIDSTQLTALRTGALCALAAKHMAREDASVAGIIGCGVQARSQLEGLTKVRKLKKVKIYDVNAAAMDAFISDMAKLGVPIEKSTADGVLDADIVVAATVSKKPVVFYEKLKKGAHVTSVGAHTPDAGELDAALVKKAKVVIDSKDCLKSGDLKDYKGSLTEIREVIAGKKVRQSAADITVFKSVGTAIQDVAIASLVYEKALKTKAGRNIDF